MDDQSDIIAQAKADVEEAEGKIEKSKEQIAALTKALAEATKMREEEQAEWEKSDADDSAALKLINMAKKTLTDFYEARNENAQFLQQDPVPEMLREGAGPYQGEQEEGAGIVGALE